jgi:hypothetical protein
MLHEGAINVVLGSIHVAIVIMSSGIGRVDTVSRISELNAVGQERKDFRKEELMSSGGE